MVVSVAEFLQRIAFSRDSLNVDRDYLPNCQQSRCSSCPIKTSVCSKTACWCFIVICLTLAHGVSCQNSNNRPRSVTKTNQINEYGSLCLKFNLTRHILGSMTPVNNRTAPFNMSPLSREKCAYLRGLSKTGDPPLLLIEGQRMKVDDKAMTAAERRRKKMEEFRKSPDYATWVYLKDTNELITIVIPALCLVLGTFGNIMSILVVSHLRGTLKSSSAAYLTYLAIFDLIGIWASLPRYLTRALRDFDFRNFHPAVCKLQRFSVYFALDVAAWITVAVTADRLIAVRFPYHASKWCTDRVSRIVLICTCAAFLLLDGHVFITYGYKETKTFNKRTNRTEVIVQNCTFPNEMSEFIWTYVQPILATLAYAVGPFAFLLVANIVIAQRLIKQSKFLKKCSTTNTAHQESGRTVRAMSYMLVASSVVFLVMNTPSFFYMVMRELIFDNMKMSLKEKAVHRLLKSCFNMSMYLNHSLNFFVYCLSAKKFRTAFWQVLLCRRNEATVLSDSLNVRRRSTHHSINHSLRRFLSINSKELSVTTTTPPLQEESAVHLTPTKWRKQTETLEITSLLGNADNSEFNDVSNNDDEQGLIEAGAAPQMHEPSGDEVKEKESEQDPDKDAVPALENVGDENTASSEFSNITPKSKSVEESSVNYCKSSPAAISTEKSKVTCQIDINTNDVAILQETKSAPTTSKDRQKIKILTIISDASETVV